MITLTAKAKEQFRKILHNNNANYVRLEVKGGGCAGFSYSFDLITNFQLSDIILDDILVLDEMSYEILQGTVIDYKMDLSGSSFNVDIPNAKSTCGCGTPFSM